MLEFFDLDDNPVTEGTIIQLADVLPGQTTPPVTLKVKNTGLTLISNLRAFLAQASTADGEGKTTVGVTVLGSTETLLAETLAPGASLTVTLTFTVPLEGYRPMDNCFLYFKYF